MPAYHVGDAVLCRVLHAASDFRPGATGRDVGVLYIALEGIVREGPIADHAFGLKYNVLCAFPKGALMIVEADQDDLSPLPDRPSLIDPELRRLARDLAALTIADSYDHMKARVASRKLLAVLDIVNPPVGDPETQI